MNLCRVFEEKIKQMVPMTAYTDFVVDDVSEARCALTIPLTQKTTNHVQSLYLGALAMGGELAPGILALYFIELSQQPIVLVFKDMHMDFLKRADTDVTFVCDDAASLKALVNRAVQSGEREEAAVEARALSADGETIFALFKLTVSIKLKA
ncbi:MAG: hypothetical protein COW89_01105 [Nitrospinae bacterium CG22_combo_CG10-13_8_21_14_all_47_10]|nr:MAG: hypothetical protein COW89_01105 [Nitrospinae bacterium CG22_combo_CG10-13_8_21_14_all_47_10]PIQ43614.1 MAG: hypothetical protein COW05_03695 [Gammaproteobacteria bacterium CG12_big_fil_rev_8_21_14_0_65_46_12]PIR10874.1 MAG: hypothetical protein COV52_06760 [Gammaproteobacteria bacterium CG11_big_fil_rev_8_21_14_0_20_46_22]